MERKIQVFKKGIFSTGYPAPIEKNEEVFYTVEHFFQAAKANHFRDNMSRRAIMIQTCPKMANELGNAIKGYRADEWIGIRDEVALEGLTLKFAQHANLSKALKETGDDILVFQDDDLYWGSGMSIPDSRLSHPTQWPGKNRLGELLMQIRETLRGN